VPDLAASRDTIVGELNLSDALLLGDLHRFLVPFVVLELAATLTLFLSQAVVVHGLVLLLLLPCCCWLLCLLLRLVLVHAAQGASRSAM
jgi:hypothetical protein